MTDCTSALNQIRIAISTTLKIVEKLEEEDLQKKPTSTKHSVGELLEHLASVCEADLLISNGAAKEEMSRYYSTVCCKTIEELNSTLKKNYRLLEERYTAYTEEELREEATSYWGVTYSRYEWLLEILAHVYHHRGQLHAILVHCCNRDPKVFMFE
ncbi:DinB family protein [Alteribacter keqinensis]|uniref:DinB family protein n=1 Tax=Alteribacter keqinensis TaxID=2483800 RepID=A0A3M7TNA1_9BACI|nr:DinB family protein [Alteribacter keqinensis]RNA66868.1 DinB family protein [Alteribacter keqinensis]